MSQIRTAKSLLVRSVNYLYGFVLKQDTLCYAIKQKPLELISSKTKNIRVISIILKIKSSVAQGQQ